MNILLTGGSGFIGKNILESFLVERYNIIAPSSKELNLLDEKSVNNFFKKNKIDFVIHAACKPGHRNAKDPNNIFYADMRMFLNLLQNSDRYKKMIVLSSGAIYDQRFEIKKAKEEDYKLHLPVDEHALFRRVSADYITQSDKIIELRIFGIFGPHEDYAIRFISNAICKSIFNLPITIKQNRSFDYLYVDDLMPILDFFLNNKASSHSYNVTPDETIELIEIAKKINNISGKKLPIEIKDKEMGLEYSGNNSKLKIEFKDVYFTPIDKAINDLYSWYSSNSQLINKDLLKIDK